MAQNGLTNPNLIFVGQKLCIPTAPTATPYYGTPAASESAAVVVVEPVDVVEPVVVASVVTEPASTVTASAAATQTADNSYRVQRGDTLSAIAAQHGTTVAALMQINSISNPNFIFAGQWIRLP
jgi:LysM repeat protein